MRKMTIFRTVSFGGTEGRDREERNFETMEAAKENAINDDWNDYFTMYEVTITFNGIITEEEKYIGKIPCAREIRRNAKKEVDK